MKVHYIFRIVSYAVIEPNLKVVHVKSCIWMLPLSLFNTTMCWMTLVLYQTLNWGAWAMRFDGVLEVQCVLIETDLSRRDFPHHSLRH